MYQRQRQSSSMKRSIVTGTILLLCTVLLLLPHNVNAASSQKKKLYEKYSNLCNGKPTITKKHEKTIKWLLTNVGEGSLLLSSSPQHEAACWMLQAGGTFQPQRFALAVLYYATKGMGWNDNTNWVTHKHECTWYGVKCTLIGKKVIELDLGFIEVNGLLPRELGLLSDLKDLDLHGNDLQGVIPHKVMVGLKQIQYLRLHMNGMFGSIHKEITNMKKLKELILFGNYMGGTIPKQLSELKQLEVIDLYANQLTGTIPKDLAKLSKLRQLDLHDNSLIGTMPKEICAMKLDSLVADCHGNNPEVKCDCCTVCCQGLPAMICVDQQTGKQVEQVF